MTFECVSKEVCSKDKCNGCAAMKCSLCKNYDKCETHDYYSCTREERNNGKQK